ncbi:MAG: glutamate racemase [Erysipelotrichales bacterium]|nr:glutamate racemase [Erysipelotrichales bacterium]
MIGVFDSGVGGLSVLKRLKELMPEANFIYYADSKNCPYGTKSLEEIYQLTLAGCKTLISLGAKAIVIACNTASLVINRVKAEIKAPIYDIISPNLRAMEKIKNRRILLLGTIKTVEGKVYENFLNKDNEIIAKEAQFLTGLAENMQIDEEITQIKIDNLLADFEDFNMLILACTHFPLFNRYFEKHAKMEVYDCGLNLALEVSELKYQYITKADEFYTSGDIEHFTKQIKYYGFEARANIL